MKVVRQNAKKITETIIETLGNGGLVIMPTETVYGAFVDATNPKAIEKLNRYKKRPMGKPYSVAVANKKMAKKYVYLNKTAENLYDNFLPGPLTVISKGKNRLAPGVQSEIGTLGIRIPNHKLVIKIVSDFDKPITATSANASYKKRPYKILDILENISQKQKNEIDLIVDAGTLPSKEPSTIIDTTVDDPVILRQGDISFRNKDKLLSRSENETQNVAKEIWQKYEKYHYKRAIIFALSGPMGAGKTQFTKGLAQAMGIKEKVISPTYAIEIDYVGKEQKKEKPILKHIDAWRMNSEKEMLALNLGKAIKKNLIIAIEWADKVTNAIKKFDNEAIIIWVSISYAKTTNERFIKWSPL